jgi:hypothetical protein
MQPTAFLRRTILDKVGWLDAAYENGKDHELWLRIGLQGTIRRLPASLAKVRRCHGLSQRSDMGRMKIELTRKFFLQPNLPSPFCNPSFRKRAMSNAFLMGGLYALNCTAKRRDSLHYVSQAIRTDPGNSAAILGKYSIFFLFYLLPFKLQDRLRLWRAHFRNMVNRGNNKE